MPAGSLLGIIRHVKLGNEFGLTASLSFLLLLRVHSETLSIKIADEDGRITEYAPNDSEILAGMQRILGEPYFRGGGTSNTDASSAAHASVMSGWIYHMPYAPCIGFGRG